MSADADADDVASRLSMVSLDVITCFAGVSLWMTFWSCLDRLEVPEIENGCAAACVVMVLCMLDSHRRLEATSEHWHPGVVAVAVFLWTFLLAVLSISIWRLSFDVVHMLILPPNDDMRAVLVALVGAVVLLAAGRYRSACDATPVGFVADGRYHGERFATPSFSSGESSDSDSAWTRFAGAAYDHAVTLPVVLVWAGVWMLGDNHEIHAWGSLLVCGLCIVAFSFFKVEQTLMRQARASQDGKPTAVVAVAEVLWTTLLAILCIMTWRGLWEGLSPHLKLAVHPLRTRVADGDAMLAAGFAFAAALVLAWLGRFRSALFPPMDFSRDGVFGAEPASAAQQEKNYGAA